MKKDKENKEINISKIFQDQNRVVNAIEMGINTALLKHKQAGNPICEWKNGKVVWVAPEKIQIKS